MKFKFHERILAVLSLLILIVLVFLALRLVVRHLLFSSLLCLSLVMLTFAAWLILSGSGKKLRNGFWLLAAGIFVLLGELFYFSTIANFLDVMLFAGLAGLYIILISYLRNAYWREARNAGTAAEKNEPFKKPYLIINPKSGNGRAIKAHIDRLAAAQGIEVLLLKKDDDVAEVARHAALKGADVLGVSGGDGSIGAVAKVALEYNLPVVVLPGGTRCHFARDIGLDPKNIVDGLAGFRGIERRVDVGEINGRIFLNNASFGLYADIIDNPDYRDNKRRVTREVLQSVANKAKPAYPLRFRHGKQVFDKAVMVLVGVNAYDMANIFEFGRREKLDAGVLQITALTKVDDELIGKLLRSSGRAKNISELNQWEVESFRISSPGKIVIAGVDGEREEYRTPVSIRILPEALRLYVPAEGMRNRPKRAFSWFMIRRLWNAALRG